MISRDPEADLLPRGGLDLDPPPPYAALLRAADQMTPVRTRRRFSGFIAALGAGVIAPLALLLLRPCRPDLAGLPRAWVIGGAAVWLTALVVSLATALVPARGDVMPSAGRASRVGGAVVVLLALAALFGSVEAPGQSVRLVPGAWPLVRSCLRCIGVALPIAMVLVVVGFVALRRVLPMGARRIGIALGAAGGAMGGLALHFHCAIAGADHVLLGHVGGVALAAIAGALLLPALLAQRRD